jgi:predicted nucleic acid-binding protein
MKPYADTNFFTRVYLALPESEKADRLLDAARGGHSPALPITWLHRMELANAFELSVWLSKQGGHPRVSSQQAAVAFATFKEDLAEQKFLLPLQADPSDLRALFEATVARHTAKHGFRTYDILHVASAQLLGCDHFFSFDERARKLAKIEGLRVIE